VRLPDLTRLLGADNSAASEDQQLDALYFDTPTCGCCEPESRCAAARAARMRAGI
jgi:hypothetical protein